MVSNSLHGSILVDPVSELPSPVGSPSRSSGKASERPRLEFIEGNAENLPFPSDSVDLYTIAFGIRNVTNITSALSEAYRVLKPGGRFMCLEFSHLPNPLAQQLYDAVRNASHGMSLHSQSPTLTNT
jgi:SAM-dependent methyltransferase